jgi:hypothetical protein
MSQVRKNFSHLAHCFAPLKIIFIVVVLIFPIVSLGTITVKAADDLGLRIDVLPNPIATKAEPYSQNRRLWLVTSEPTTTSRTIKITSSVNNPQLITLDISGARRIGEDTQIDVDNESEIKPWTSFSDSNFILPAFGQKTIQITITPPENLKDYSQDAFLIVKSAATNAPKIDKKRTVGILNSVFQFATPLFYGIGDIKNLVSVQIKDIDTYIDENGKYAEIEIFNNGVGPVEISGDAQFTNLEFQTENVGPLQYSLPPLLPGEQGYGTLRLPETMVPGKWKIFIQAYAGSYGDAVVITKNLTFEYKQNSQLPRIILFIASLLLLMGLLFLQRKLRKKISPVQGAESVEIKGRRRFALVFEVLRRLTLPKEKIHRMKKSEKALKDNFDIDKIDQMIDEMVARSKARSASTGGQKLLKKSAKKPVKKIAKKSPTKKMVAKKISGKAPIKKRTQKKALPKKKIAKKAVAKRS